MCNTFNNNDKKIKRQSPPDPSPSHLWPEEKAMSYPFIFQPLFASCVTSGYWPHLSEPQDLLFGP